MTEKEMFRVSIYTAFFVLLSQAFSFAITLQISIQLILVVIMGYRLKPYQTFVPTVSNLIIFSIIAYPIYDIANGSFANIFLSSAFAFNLGYILSTYLMSKYLQNEIEFGVPYNQGRKKGHKLLGVIIALAIGVGIAVFIGMSYSLLLNFFG